ncbi:hypothetical protein DPMN_023025 [Dreissena polymorpha]|uniref:Uncharacterized protein n=1 Tax=Dreissena polymorpha TaxID=45954 RepID=A0A9D4LLK7_DREPO|nr:hypothetical protein DPMN_023025 [Dreissena polymorpha]
MFFEEGCVRVNDAEGNVIMVVSSDGYFRKYETFKSTTVAIEIKCLARQVHTDLPERLYLQCQTELKALAVRRILYVSSTGTESKCSEWSETPTS